MREGIVSDIQPYAVHDGPGIRTLVFLKGCPLACVWCCNPESQGFGLDLRQEASRCQGCLRCVTACSSKAVTAAEGRPRVSRDACARCVTLECVEGCPHGAFVAVGRRMTAEAVVAEVARDAAFFRNSGGGVTFSGGEPLAQPELLLEMLGLLADRGIRAAVETCGHARPEDVAAVEPLVEAFLFDVKTLDPARHAELTGRDNALILANLRGLAARVPAKVTVRHAIIPGLNDDRGTQEALVDLMRELGLTRLDLEPYHPLGEAKYVSLGRACPCSPDPRALDEARVQEMVGYFRGRGLECDVA